MILNPWFYVLILAVVQGIAEFLPISSSGHLALLGNIFGLQEDESLALGILLHAGSLVAICIFYLKTLLGFFRKDQIHLGLMVLLGSVPAGIFGVALKATGLDERMFNSPLLVGISFLITATVLRLSEKPKLIVRTKSEENEPPTQLKKITVRQTLIVGFSQMFAILPGISRSGSTISAGILSGIDREAAGTFSFLLALPAIGGAAFLELLNLVKTGPEASDQISYLQMGVGLLVSALVSFGALALLMKVIRRGKLSWFSWYLYAAGIAVIFWQITVAVKGH